MALIKCPKCETSLNDDCIVVWKCNECGKAVKFNLAKLHKIQELKKQKPDKHLLNCSACGSPLDDGNEKIVCKCSSCGNVIGGNLEYFTSDNLEDKIIEATMSHIDTSNQENVTSMNLIHCPECGKQILIDSKICGYCGFIIKKTTQDKKIISKKRIVICCFLLMCIIIGILLKNIIFKLPDAERFVYKQALEIEQNLDREDFKLEAAYCYRVFDPNAEIGDRRRILVIQYSVLGTNGERDYNVFEYMWRQGINEEKPHITNYSETTGSSLNDQFKQIGFWQMKEDIATAQTKDQITFDEWMDFEIGYVPIDIDIINQKLK